MKNNATLCYFILTRYTGESGRTVFEWQPQSAQPSLWAGSLQQTVNNEYWELPAQPPSTSDCCRRTLLHHSVPKNAGTISCHGLMLIGLSNTLYKIQTALML